MKTAFSFLMFLALAIYVRAETIDEVEQAEKDKMDKLERSRSSDIREKEAETKAVEDKLVEDQSTDIRRAEEAGEDDSIENTPDYERLPGQGLRKNSTLPGGFIPHEMDEDIAREFKNRKCDKCTKEKMCGNCSDRLDKLMEKNRLRKQQQKKDDKSQGGGQGN